MASTTFDTYERSPQGVRWREKLARDQARTRSSAVSTSDLWGKRQEQFIQKLLSQEVTQQLWPTLDQDDLALACLAHRLDDLLGTE